MKDVKIILPVGCNAKCNFCFWNSDLKQCDNYFDKFTKNFNNFIYNENVKANISGGEPTLYKYLIDFLILIKSMTNIKKIILTTNGSNLLPLIPKLKGKLNHINISRHHYLDSKNDKIFGCHFDIDYKTITSELNKIGIDVRCNCTLDNQFKDIKDLEKMIQWAIKNGFNSIKFRNDFNKGIDICELEKMFQKKYAPINESYCLVCRINTYINKIPVLFAYGVLEPSEKQLDFEYVFNTDGNLYYDYSYKKLVSNYKIDKATKMTLENKKSQKKTRKLQMKIAKYYKNHNWGTNIGIQGYLENEYRGDYYC